MRLQQALLHPHPMESNPAWAQTGVTMLERINFHRVRAQYHASCDIRAAPTRVQRFAGNAERETIPRADLIVVFLVRISKIYTSGIRIRTNQECFGDRLNRAYFHTSKIKA
jgi:hypothetical protein